MTAQIAKTPSIVDLNNASFSTCAEADRMNDELMRRLGLKSRNMAARLAIARSLAVTSAPKRLPKEERGRVIRGATLFGDDLAVWVALLLEHVEAEDLGLEQIQDLFARHWSRGAYLLTQDWQNVGSDFDKFVLTLASQAGVAADGKVRTLNGVRETAFVPVSGKVVVPIGNVSEDIKAKKRVEWVMNAPGETPHVAVVGAAGTGKTRTAMTMLRSIHAQSKAPVLLFDMAKGDLASDRSLVEALGAKVIDPLASPLPLDVLYARSSEIPQASMRFRESFKRVPSNRIGDGQGDILREAAEAAYAGPHPVRLSDLQLVLEDLYAAKKKKPDVVTATFKDMTTWNLFEPDLAPAEFFSRSWVVDLSKAPETVKRLVCFLLFDAAYNYLSTLEDAPLDDEGHRSLRLVLAVDEARLVLGYQHQSLIGLVRESRSKGGALLFMSQSPDDFDQKNENYFENIGLGVCFRTAARSGALNAMLGQQPDLSSLKPGICVTRLADRRVVQVQAWK